MRRVGRFAALLGLAAMLAACARPAPPSPPVTAAAPGPLPPGIEGRYRGTARLVRAANNFCPRSGPRTLELTGPVLTLSYSVPPRQRVPLTADIQSDGRLLAEDGVGTLDGQWTNGLLEVTIGSEMCEHRWTLTRIG